MFGSVVLRLRFGRPCSLLRLRRKELAMNKICEKASVFAAAVAVVAACAVSGCAPNASNPASDTALGDGAGTAGVSIDWSVESDCGTCHAKEDLSMAEASGSVGAHGALACTDCHEDESILAEAHADATADKAAQVRGLRQTQVSEEACLACHESWEALSQQTSASDALTDAAGKVVNPHQLPANSEHEGVTCSSCHDMHSGKDAEQSASEYCTTCHHSGVYECYTCHE